MGVLPYVLLGRPQAKMPNAALPQVVNNAQEENLVNPAPKTNVERHIENGNNNAINRYVLRMERERIQGLSGEEKIRAQKAFNQLPGIKAHEAEKQLAENMAKRGAEKLRLRRLAEASQTARGGSRRKNRKSKRKTRARKTN